MTTSSSFTSFLKSKWRSSPKDGKQLRQINSVIDVERDWVRHSALKLALEGDFKAPIDQLLKSGGSEVLDIGCGAGFWTTDMATKYPISHFTGIDIEKNIFPTGNVSRNVVFQRVDLLELPLPYENDTFDFIFIRCMADVVPDEDWDAVLKELVRIMKKGAYIECLETYPALVDAGPAMTTIMQHYIYFTVANAPDQDSMTASIQNPLPNRMAAISQLMGMQIKHIHTPVGRYGGAVGSLLLEHWDRIIETNRQKWVQSKLISEKQLAAAIKDLHEEVDTHQTYMSWYSVVAQKKGYKGPLIQIEDFDSLMNIDG
ncbi:S-adenosyl-L-methionine-dependent methyltransferase [Zychaea mexicana]|uniref:S-adenosyl-L-methionine-dependent methyltransferase n=1 Tax=Zychaea mexicana TaxID=64656 RepID=UPI0022FDFBD1|nr:S-adenosyl-L-methionine-dependent methyltransferase [Zychaea mexicana]KAI9497010.1 S-adenosyl-L-methionine-dependent methyltransferase [Zychaea mexicana]